MPSEIDKADVLGLVRHMQRHGYAGWTIRTTLGPLSLLMQWCADQGWRTGNPVAELRRNEKPKTARKRVKPIPTEALWRIVDAAGDADALVATLAFTGVRLEEALGVRWADLDLDEGLLTVTGQMERARREPDGTLIPGHRVEYAKTEAGLDREIDLPGSLVRILRRHRMRSRHSQPGDLVFCWATGRPLDHRAASRRLDGAVVAAGLDDGRRVTPHVLRHNFGSLLIEAGENIAQVSRMLGHSDVATTLRTYTHAVARAERRSRSLVSTFDRGTSLEQRGEDTRVTGAAAEVVDLGQRHGSGDTGETPGTAATAW